MISGGAAAYSIKQSQDDALFLLKQQAVYGVVFTAFLASSAIYNQRRSRRILAVLSKAVSRAEYLAGLEVGFLVAAAVYSAAVGVLGAWVFARAGFSAAHAIPIAFMLFAASALAGSVALLFSTFLSPLFAIALTAIVVGINGVLVQIVVRSFCTSDADVCVDAVDTRILVRQLDARLDGCGLGAGRIGGRVGACVADFFPSRPGGCDRVAAQAHDMDYAAASLRIALRRRCSFPG